MEEEIQNINCLYQGQKKILENCGKIQDLVYDLYCEKFATCDNFGMIKIFQSIDQKIELVQQFQAHKGKIQQIQWSHPNHYNCLISCGIDSKIKIWQQKKLNKFQNIYVNDSFLINSICIVPYQHGFKILSATQNGNIALFYQNIDQSFDFLDFGQIHKQAINSISCQPFTQDKQFQFASGSQDGIVIINQFSIETQNLQKIYQFQAHNSQIRDLQWSPAVGAYQDLIATCSDDNYAIIWNIREQNKKIELIHKDMQNIAPVQKVSFNPQGNMIALTYGQENETSIFIENSNGEWELLHQD